ncbi:putative stealth protein CR2 region 2 [Plasmopara halstedii]
MSSSRSRSSVFMLLFFFLGVLLTSTSFIFLEWKRIDRNNIGNVKSNDYLSYGPIDVVYTWVNGTDPRWKREKEFWHKHWIASLTGQPLPVWGQDTDVLGKDDSNSDNRFRDNEELRYSLRSLEKYAPWVRHVYVVTDGQIPSWLDIDSPNLSIIKHRDIFTNSSHLPVFSSPAIEWNLDNIDGLSDMFLYFNDDVFLGSPVRPEDFVSQAGVQKIYFAWEIPQCADRCWEANLGNGRCDRECNVTACDYDMGDCGCDVNLIDDSLHCDPEKVASILDHTPNPMKISNHLCEGMCQYFWLGNGLCERSCNISSCAFDGGDCRVVESLESHYPHVLDDEEATKLSPLIKELWSAEVKENHTLVHVPLDVNATYLNLTDAFGVNGSIFSAVHDNGELIRFASIYETDLVLILVFGRDRNAKPMTSSVQMTIIGENAKGDSIQLDFSIVRGNKQMDAANFQEIREVSSGMFTFENTSVRPYHIRLPFGFRQATFRNIISSRDEDLKLILTEENVESLVEEQMVYVANQLAHEKVLVEVFLPFNLTGKKLIDGEFLNLGWNLDLRLHNDENDLDWSDDDICQLIVPNKTLTSLSAAKSEVEETVVDDKRNLNDQIDETIKLAGGDESFIREEVDQDAEDHLCRLAENNRGIYITVQIPTKDDIIARSAFENEEWDIFNTPTASDLSASDSNVVDTEKKENFKMLNERKMSPQITDGKLCFYDTDRADPWRYRYCFALAMGQYHLTKVDVVHKPTLWDRKHLRKRKILFSPEDNLALLEFDDQCIDTTERYIGIQPQLCYPNEATVLRDYDQDKMKVDPRQENEEEGRRLACEAQQRRLALREEREKEMREAQANSSLLERLSRFVGTIQLAIGFGNVVSTNENIEDVQYADVCGPLSSTKSRRETQEVTTKDVQAHLSKDTFGDSLRYVNKLYNRVFGKPKTSERRRVPSHMPFLLQKSIIREIKDFWTKEIENTSTHRFRHPQDMQFSFSYFHYLINRAKIHPHTLQDIWREYLDANRNGVLDEDEVLTAASLAHGDAPPEDFVTTVRNCIQPAKREKVREFPTGEGTIRLQETLTPYITLEQLERCPSVRDALIQNVRYENQVELMPETEVTFHMLSDNYKFAWKQMMGTRARRTKFVCINDDMKSPSMAVSQILHELFLSIWPKRSQFELPYHLKNRYTHIDEYTAAHERRQTAVVVAIVIVMVLAFVFRTTLFTLFGFQTIARARAISASQLTHELQKQQEDEVKIRGKSWNLSPKSNINKSKKAIEKK